MLPPKYTLVGLAGQNAWHIATGVALPRAISGKYLPSQLRTQNAGPEPLDAIGRGGAAGCWLRPNGSANKFACGGAFCSCCFWPPPNRKSNRPSSDDMRGASATDAVRAAVAISVARRRMG